MELGNRHIEILKVLSDGSRGFYLTHHIAEKAPMVERNMRVHSHSIKARLFEMESLGLVKRIDGDAPFMWGITQAGREAIHSEVI